MYVYHDGLKGPLLKQFSKIGHRIATDTQNKRDMVAHGLWSRIDGKWWVLRLRGQRATPELRPELEKLSRAFLPQRELITKEKLDSIIQEIIAKARGVEAFRESIYHVLPREPFRYAPAKYSRQRRRS